MSKTIMRVEITEKTPNTKMRKYGLDPDGISYLLHNNCKISIAFNEDSEGYGYDRLMVQIPKDLPLDRIVLFTATVFSDCLGYGYALEDILSGVDDQYVGITGDIHDNSDY